MKLRYTIKTVGFVLLLVLGVARTTSAAQAASGQNITISPSSTQLSIDPGTTKTGSLTILNENTTAYNFETNVSPYSVKGEDYDPSFTQLPGTITAAKWVQVEPPKISYLGSRQIANINYTVTVPAGTPPGGYYAVIFAKTRPTPGNSVTSSSQVGDILYISVSGPVKNSGTAKLTSLPPFTLSKKLDVTVKASNTGGVHYIASTQLKIKSFIGTTAYASTNQRFVLPQTIRNIKTTWETPPLGIYQVSGFSITGNKRTELKSSWILVVHPAVLVVLLACLALVGLQIKLKTTKQKRSQQSGGWFS